MFAQTEVDKILFELTAGKLGEAPDVMTATLPAPAGQAKEREVEEEEVSRSPGLHYPDTQEEDDLEEMQSRLQALRS